MLLTVRAYGKLNLTLEALSKREDGYHEIATVLQTVSVSDTLVFGEGPSLTLRCSDPALENETNLALRAARLLQEATGCAKGASISLMKGIPTAAGLGGGSTDAASTLWALDRLWGLNLGLERLGELAAAVGSDVPYFLRGGTALAEGRGERLTPLPSVPERWYVIVTPAIALPNKTAAMYGRLRPHHWTTGRAVKLMAEALRCGSRIREAYSYNVFDLVADEIADVGVWRQALLDLVELAPSRTHVAGSGPSLYLPVASAAHGCAVVDALPREGASYRVVRTVPYARAVLARAGV